MHKIWFFLLIPLVAFAVIQQATPLTDGSGDVINGLLRATILVYDSETGGDFIWAGTTDGSLPALRFVDGYIHNIEQVIPGYVKDMGELWIEIRVDGPSISDGRILYIPPVDRRPLHRTTPGAPGETSETLVDELQIGLPGHELYVASATTGFGVDTPVEKVDIDGAVGLKGMTTPPTATTDFGKVYVDDSDGHLYYMDEGGTATDLLETTAGTGGGGAFLAAFTTDQINTCVDKTVYLGVHLAATADPYTHLWTGDTGPLSATDIPNPTFSTSTAGVYNLSYTITDSDGASSKYIFTVVVHADPTPTISAYPASGGCVGESVVLTGDGCYEKYCWNPDGPCTKGFEAVRSGTYDLIVVDEWGCRGSESYSVAFLDPPVANSGPNITACHGIASPTVGGSPAATGGTPPYFYEWTGTGTPFLSSVSAPNPTFNVTSASPGVYNLVLTVVDGNGCEDESDLITVTVYSNPAASATSNSPVCTGNAINLTCVPSSGTSPYTFLWSGPSGFTTTTQSPSISGATIGNAGTYQVEVTDVHGCVSGYATTEVVVNEPPLITGNPSDEIHCEGESASFTVSATGSSPLTYQWHVYDGVDFSTLSGETGATLTLSSVTWSLDGNQYRCVVSGVCSPDAVSTGATLVVREPVSISVDPTDVTLCEDSPATFTVTASGYTITYQWQLNTGSGWTGISGATSTSYVVTPPDDSYDGYQYRCVVTDGCSVSLTSAAATLTVNAKPVVTVHPSDQSVDEGDPATFSVTATGTGLTYQWQLDSGSGWADISGATGGSYNISSTTAGMDGYQYRCVISGTCSPDATSNPATLSVTIHGSVAFNYTGSSQSWTVPAGVTSVSVTLYGAQGGTGYGSRSGGQGGTVTGTMAVTPGESMQIIVGGQGATGTSDGGGGGGGMSAIRRGSTPVGVAGGGGGGGGDGNSYIGAVGGSGGGTGGGGNGGNSVNYGPGTIGGNGGTGTGAPGTGTSTARSGGSGFGGGGSGATYTGGDGTAYGTGGTCSGGGGNGGYGGAGAGGYYSGTYHGGGGGGGGGYNGGGGGSGNYNGYGGGGGGGGGSSYTGGLTSASASTGGHTGNGQVLISW